MSIKKNIGVLVLLLVLLSMSAVSAEDVSINANDTYQTPNEIQKDFTSLQTDIDNSQGVFELTYDVKHGDDEIDNYGISITKTTIINGNGHTIDANGHGSIFVVKDSSVTLTLNDLTLINANPVSDSSGIVSNGGAVYFDGSTLIVNNVNFKNNTVYKYGGAIYTTGTCIVDSSVFDGNDVQFRSQNIDNGGAAIYADNGASLLISNSQIINNHKNMVIRDNNVGDLVDGVVVATGYTKISKSYFRNNSGCYGGAVTSLGYTNAGKNQIIIENSVFDANRAFQGAAVNVIGSTFKISGTNFTNNKGVGYGSGNPNVGTLLTWYGCEGTISDCNFINNTADNGAAYRLGDDNNGVSSASVDSCTFINNTATNQGGAIYEGGKIGKATLDIKNSIFTNNSAKKGSAIYSGYTLNIDDDTTFTNNMVYMYYTGTLNIGEIKTFSDLQKAINMVEGDIHLSSNVTMLASEADNFVNGIVVDHLVNLKCDGFTINANNLGRIFNVTSTADKLNIYNANLINGNADIGGAIYNTGSVYAYNTNFINNTAATMGGAVFNNGTLTIQKCIVDNNDITKRTSSDSEDYGGAAIYNWYDSTLFIKNSTISNNLKNYKNGDYVVGAVTSLGKTIISQNSYFVNNSGRWGGAITTSGSSLPGKKVNELSISDSTFSKNGGLYGAGIFIQGSKFSIASCVFDSNTAFGKGNMTPNNNNGAAIEVTDTNKAIAGTITGSKFTNNKAQYGGAIDICEGNIKITDSIFVNNSADVEGGAIDINTVNGNPEVSISGSKFINNSASYGGAIVNVKDLTVRNTEFVNNTPNTIFNYVGFGGNLDLGIENFTDLQNAIGLVTGTLTLNQNVVMTAKEAADFTNGITINKDITIDGKGHTIDAKNLGRIFSIGEGFTVTLTNATLINGKATEGGAIYNDGSLTLSDVKLSDNAADSYGGAVFNNGELVVSDSVFDSNDIVNRGSASVDYGGAAIYNWKEGTLKVTNSNFTNNIKNYKNGDNLVGAITTIGNATVSGSNFVNNSGRWGGAISATGAELRKNSSTLTVSNTIFKDNSALYAGAVYIWGSNYNIADCVFDNNTAFGKGNMTPNNNNGGALVVSQVSRFNEPITGTISGSKFTNNKAQYGGAAYFNKGFVTITDSVFENNVATAEGGAVDFSHASVKDLVVSINNSSFVGNKAPVAGAIFTNVDSKITNSNFINNSAAKIGGAICNVNDLTVENSKFVNNTPQAIHNSKELHLGIETFTDLQNAIDLVDGILTLDSDIAMTDDEAAGFVNGVIINKDIVIDGKGHTIDAKNLGRIFSIGEGFTVTLTNATLINGKATEGGAIYNDGSLTLSDVKLSDNAADSYGGAVFNNGELVVDNSAFEDNAANYYGGAIFNWDDLQVTNSAFDGNDILVRNIRAMDNVDHGGAAIYNWKNGKLDISKSNFTNNIKNYKNGDRLVGAVATIGDATISDSYFVNNSGRWGGALSVMGGEFSIATNFIDIDGTKFVNNSALYGGAMFVWGSNYSISNSVFDKNTAFGKGNMTPNNNNGGALVVTQGNIPISGTIINSNFTNNKAQYGGAAWINEGTVDISNSNFINNTATVEAGAIGFEPAYTKITATVYGTNFINNTAGVDGGAIYSNGDLRISDSDFDNNKAQKADIIYSNINGLLSINGNNYSNYTENKAPIINLGGIETISSDGGVIITVLDNKTVNVCYGDVVTLHAIITVDGVLVANQDLSFSVYNGENVVVCKANSLLNGSYVATYKINDVINKTVSIVYDGPEVHINTGILNVSKANPDLTVDAVDITVGDLEIITVTGPKDATGLITLTLNGIDYILPIYNGEAKFYFQDLAYGTYDVSASYSGDNHYVAAKNSIVFKVDKVLANLNIHVEDITFGENGLVIITLPSDIDGSIVTVNVNGKVYPVDIENGFGKLPLRELDAGDYTISAVFAGNDKYLPGVSNALLTVSKADPALNVLISDVGYDGVFNINVALTGVDAIGLNGNVIVTVNNKDYSVNIVNGKGTAVGVKLAAGTYDFTAAWAGNDNYNAVGDSGKFSVAKVDSIIDVAVSDIKVGEDAVISVKLLSDATGSVTVTVNGKDYTETVVNGVANVKVADLKAGTYDVAVKYSGDNNYNAAVATSSFTVSKVDSTMDVTVNDIVFGGDLIVDAVLPDDATGEVVITVNGVDYHVSIENGKATGTISGLAAGDYTVTVKYAGDDKYTGVEVAENVNVAKAQPVLGVVIADVDYGNGFVIEATLTGVNSAPLSGNVIVTVAGKEYTVKVTDGKGIFTGDKLAAGTYGFAAVWAGDDNYNIVTENGDFKVNKVDSAINVAVDSIEFGEDAVISVKLASDATGEVVITVNGEDYTAAIENGVVSVTVSGLKADDYTVEVKYAGDNNYNEATGSAEFSVLKITPDMDVFVDGTVFGGDLTVDISLPAGATGDVIITVKGEDYILANYTEAVVDGKVTKTIGGLDAGYYTIAVKYAGDDNYNAVDVTKGVNVAKAQPVLGVVIADVDYGNGFVIEATLTGVNNAPLSGNVIVTVNGKEYTVKVTDGKGIATGDRLAAGTYAFTAAWAGDDNYNIVAENGDFKVNKVDSSVAVNVNNIKVGEELTITVNVPSDATGDVTVSVDGKEYKVAIENGKAVKTISGLKADDYTVTVKYAGDNNYNEATADAEFSVSKISDYNMDISVPEIKEGVNSTISVDLPKDATGTVTVEIDGKKYTANVIDGTANVIVSGLSAGDYNITTVYSGDAKYDSMTKKGNITVIPNINVNLDVSDVEMFYHDGTRLIAKLTDFQGKPIVNATIYFSINGVIYAKTTDANGTASMGLNLDSNVYPVTVTYNGSAFYSKISKNITVTINSSIIADDLVKMYQNATRFYAKFIGSDGKVLANTQVRFNIHGVFYTKTTNNDGVADLGIMLRPGTYILTAYNPVTGEQQGFNITVKSLIVQNDLTKYYMNASKFQATIYDKNGSLAVNKNVTFNIHGVFYTRTTDENGVVSLGISLRPGEYVITTMYEGLDLGNTVTVLPTLVTHDLNMKYMDGSNFTAQTLDGQGNPLANQNVSFNVNGVFYHKVTDDNGFASLTIRLMSGKYIITSSWNDFQTGNNITIS
nr:Ig-like domain repeat protein [Methanobrevibacter smithii]